MSHYTHKQETGASLISAIEDRAIEEFVTFFIDGGVLTLHEALTGSRRPLDLEALLKAGKDQFRKTINEIVRDFVGVPQNQAGAA